MDLRKLKTLIDLVQASGVSNWKLLKKAKSQNRQQTGICCCTTSRSRSSSASLQTGRAGSCTSVSTHSCP